MSTSIVSRKRRGGGDIHLSSLIQQQNMFDESLLALVAEKRGHDRKLPSAPRVVRRRTNASQAATIQRIEEQTTIAVVRSEQHDVATTSASSHENLMSRFFGPVSATLNRRTGAFGVYQLGKRLAQGSFGIVYRAKNTEGGQRLAVKLISKKACDEDACEALKREVDLLMFVKHVNVVGCEDVLHGAGHIGLVTQLCYKDLRDYASQRVPLFAMNNKQESFHSWEFMRHVSKALFSGLSYLHSNGIVHLDIKPENILLKRKAAPEELTWEDFCLCDFGMSQRADEDVLAETTAIIPTKACGTPGFVAPELYSSPGVYDGRAADMFSAGVTLVDLVYGLKSDWDAAYEVLSYDVERGVGYLSEQLSGFAASKFKDNNEDLHDLTCSLLEMYPPQRLSAAAALHHPFVSEIADD